MRVCIYSACIISGNCRWFYHSYLIHELLRIKALLLGTCKNKKYKKWKISRVYMYKYVWLSTNKGAYFIHHLVVLVWQHVLQQRLFYFICLIDFPFRVTVSPSQNGRLYIKSFTIFFFSWNPRSIVWHEIRFTLANHVLYDAW